MALLGIRLVTAAANLNSFRYAATLQATAGDAWNLDIQLVDRAQMLATEGYNPAGLRYIPASGSTLMVRFNNLNAARQFSRAATNPFPDDRSIWRVPILASDPINGTVDLTLTLTESGVTRTFYAPAAIGVTDPNSGVC